MDAPPPNASELTERFRRDVERALGREVGPTETLALAVSGGPDSMAMLSLAHAAYPGRVVAATYDHRVRTGSSAEATAVGAACADLSVEHHVLSPSSAVRVFRHAEARRGRYAALQRWAVEVGARTLLTAHHADDQAETLLMRLNRGSGLAGMAGIRKRREVEVSFPIAETPLAFDVYPLMIVRPLLGWRKEELHAVAVTSGLPIVDDPSNADDRFERAGVRRFLAGQTWLDVGKLAQTSQYLGDAEADLRAIEAWLWKTRRVRPEGVVDENMEVWLDVTDLPRELRRRLARAAIADIKLVNGIQPDFDRATNIEPLLDALEASRAATQAGVIATPKGHVWRFAEAPPRRSS